MALNCPVFYLAPYVRNLSEILGEARVFRLLPMSQSNSVLASNAAGPLPASCPLLFSTVNRCNAPNVSSRILECCHFPVLQLPPPVHPL